MRKFDLDDAPTPSPKPAAPLPELVRSYGVWRGVFARADMNFGVEVFHGGRWESHLPTKDGVYPLLEFKAFVNKLQSDRCRGLFRKWSDRRYAKTLAAVCKLAAHLETSDMFTGLLLNRMEEADRVDIRTEACYADWREAARRQGADATLHDFPPDHHDEYLSKIITGHIGIGS